MSFYGFCTHKQLSHDQVRAFRVWLGVLRENIMPLQEWEELWEEFEE